MAAKKAAQTQKTEKKTCFVIMPFSDPEGYEPGHFRHIYEYTFVPAIKAAGYEPVRIDDNSVSNLIHSKMFHELVTAPMALCDLTSNNPNVLYELGIRHAFDLPVVLVQEYGQDRIFDIGSITSVEYHRSRLYEDVLVDHETIRDAILQTANAKNKYSIMSLAALSAAKPMTGESVSTEAKMEYFMDQIFKRMSNLERQIGEVKAPETQRPAQKTLRFENRQLPREDCFAEFLEKMDGLEEMLDMVDRKEAYMTAEYVKKRQLEFQSLYKECRDMASESQKDRAVRLLERLRIRANMMEMT